MILLNSCNSDNSLPVTNRRINLFNLFSTLHRGEVMRYQIVAELLSLGIAAVGMYT